MFRKLLLGMLSCLITINGFAMEPAAKEETTPPPANGALTAEQIPPITGNKPAPAQVNGNVTKSNGPMSHNVAPADGYLR